MSDPFAVEGPGLISFSGGRTSGYLLGKIVEAHNGKLPSDLVVLFTNTGREMPATLDFVRDCAVRFGVGIHWLEYRVTDDDQPSYEEVTYETAHRDPLTGGPFDIYLDHIERTTASNGNEPYLPGPGMRVCTTELKIRVMKKWMLAHGFKHWTNYVGIRFDEPKRWRKINRNPPERWNVELPLVDERHTLEHVARYWLRQRFDLGLAGSWEGNCGECHLKMPWKVARVFRAYPERAVWGLGREARAGKRFRQNGPSIADIVKLAQSDDALEGDDAYEIQCGACTE